MGLIYVVAAKPHARRGELVFAAFVLITTITLAVAAVIDGWATTSEAPAGLVFAVIVMSLLPLAVPPWCWPHWRLELGIAGRHLISAAASKRAAHGDDSGRLDRGPLRCGSA